MQFLRYLNPMLILVPITAALAVFGFGLGLLWTDHEIAATVAFSFNFAFLLGLLVGAFLLVRQFAKMRSVFAAFL